MPVGSVVISPLSLLILVIYVFFCIGQPVQSFVNSIDLLKEPEFGFTDFSLAFLFSVSLISALVFFEGECKLFIIYGRKGK